MARSRSSGKRKTRIWAEISGTTLSVIPSGVTIDSSGINVAGTALSTTELGYVNNLANSAVGNGLGTGASLMEYGVADKANNAILTNGASNVLGITLTNISSLTSVVGTLQNISTGTSTAVTSGASVVHVEFTTSAATFFVFSLVNGITLTAVDVDDGVSVAWMAFGT